MPVDLRERDERKNKAEEVERKSAATTNQRQRQDSKNQSGGRKTIGFGHLAGGGNSGLGRHDLRRIAVRKIIRKFRQQTDEAPVFSAVHKNRRPPFGAAFGNPLLD